MMRLITILQTAVSKGDAKKERERVSKREKTFHPINRQGKGEWEGIWRLVVGNVH